MHTTEIWALTWECRETHLHGEDGWRPSKKEFPPSVEPPHEHLYIIHHNGGYDGDIIIVDVPTQTETKVPFDVVMELVGQMVQSEMIEQLEAESGSGTLRRIAGGQP